jgi:hypothetical protein
MNSDKQPYNRLFPLHVAPIDWYFLCDDFPDYPMVFYLTLDFSGRLDPILFGNALEEALLRHPLLYSIVQPAKQNLPCWVLAPDQLAQVDWGDTAKPLEFKGGDFIDIHKTTGLRIWARQGDDSTRVTMQFHHATCDGTGAYRFVGDLLCCYMSRLESCAGQVELAPVDASGLRVRRTKMRTLRLSDSFFKKTSRAYGEVWKTFGHRIASIRKPDSAPVEQVLPGIVNREFTAKQLANLRQVAVSKGATFNDLLLCRMFQSVVHWNGDEQRRRKIRILVPSDMRDGEDFECPACNMTAYTFVTRTAGELADEEKLLDMIRLDTLQIKNGNLQKAFMNGLTSAMATPFFLPMMLKRNVCLATCVLSNAGDPSRRFTGRMPKKQGKVSCDEFTLEAITGVPPLRRNTRCTLSSSIYGRNLTFSMRCDPHSFSMDDTDELLKLFCDKLSIDAG